MEKESKRDKGNTNALGPRNGKECARIILACLPLQVEKVEKVHLSLLGRGIGLLK